MQSLSLFTHAHVVGRKGDERRRDSRSKRYRPVSLARALARSLCVRCGQNLHFFLPLPNIIRINRLFIYYFYDKISDISINMNIKYGMILAAGLGKRMQPLTLKTPKPLLEINNYTLLERAINLLISHGVQEISINVHYLSDQIKSFINRKKFKVKITISNEENLLLDTGGGVLKGTQNFGDNPFFVINPDTVWSKHYLAELKSLEAIYLKNNKPTLLLVNKKLSIDPSFKGDFNLNNEKISKDSENQFIFTGLQIINRSVFTNEKSEVFSLNKVWDKLIKDKNLLGLESNQKFYHLNTSDMYRKIQSLNIID